MNNKAYSLIIIFVITATLHPMASEQLGSEQKINAIFSRFANYRSIRNRYQRNVYQQQPVLAQRSLQSTFSSSDRQTLIHQQYPAVIIPEECQMALDLPPSTVQSSIMQLSPSTRISDCTDENDTTILDEEHKTVLYNPPAILRHGQQIMMENPATDQISGKQNQIQPVCFQKEHTKYTAGKKFTVLQNNLTLHCLIIPESDFSQFHHISTPHTVLPNPDEQIFFPMTAEDKKNYEDSVKGYMHKLFSSLFRGKADDKEGNNEHYLFIMRIMFDYAGIRHPQKSS